MRLIFLYFILITGSLQIATAQIRHVDHYFSGITMHVDTLKYSWEENSKNGKLFFSYNQKSPVAEVYLDFLRGTRVDDIELIYSADYEILDSMIITDQFARFKVRFKDLTEAKFLKFTFKAVVNETEDLLELPLFPYTNTYVELYTQDNELYIGEEKTYELTSNFPSNIQVDNRWTKGLVIDYKTSLSGNKLYLHLIPNKAGNQVLDAPLNLKNPNVDNGGLIYELPSIRHDFTVKKGRLAFLQFDQQEVTPYEDNRKSIELQLDNHLNLSIGKTYRLEDQEKPGGPLIAEIFTRNRLNNDKVMVEFRPYAFHRKSSGYLYIKDGDLPRFVTNLNITPRTEIQKIHIQRDGQDWEAGDVVYPGEIVNVKIEGDGLHKANFSFPGVFSTRIDSLVHNEKLSLYKLSIPRDINTNKIQIFNYEQDTKKSLKIKEYQNAKTFDFIDLRINESLYHVDKVRNIYFEDNISDITIAFDEDKIDEQTLYGKQFISIKLSVRGKSNNLIELYEFDHLVICPGENSPRYRYYDAKDCRIGDIILNDVLKNKTYDLEEWSKIDIEIKHDAQKHGRSALKKKLTVILKRTSSFDIDVSFPAGLLILELGDGDKENTFSNFGGISFAMIAQFSFYQPGKIAKYKPYRFGAGFIGIDAFNFSENNDRRDVGLVALGSIYPADKKRKLTFPLYAGFGYLLRKEKAFFLVGPGIRVRL